MARRLVLVVTVLVLGTFLLSPTAVAQQGLPPGSLVISVLVEKRVLQLPDGPLYWRVEDYPTLAQAQAVAGLWGLAAEFEGKVWLFRLGPASGSSGGGRKVAEVGPIPSVVAPEYLLRINTPSGPLGSTTIVHTHPGSEGFYVLRGEICVRTAQGVMRIPAGRSEAGAPAGTPTQVSSCGSTDLRAFVMFVVDATKPFSTPANFP
jgi:quercetin dioxygenase-like cupin family protein